MFGFFFQRGNETQFSRRRRCHTGSTRRPHQQELGPEPGAPSVSRECLKTATAKKKIKKIRTNGRVPHLPTASLLFY